MKLSWKFLLTLFVFNLLATSPIWLRAWPADTDPYFLASHIREGTVPAGYPPGFFALMSFFIWDEWFMRAVPVLLTFFAALEVGFIADSFLGGYAKGKHEVLNLPSKGKLSEFVRFFSRLLWEEPGWVAAFLVYGFPVFLFRFGIFEEDGLGLVFCLAGLFFVFEYLRQDQNKASFVLSAAFFLLALLTWRGSIFFVLLAGLLGAVRPKRSLLLGYVGVALLAAWLFGAGIESIPMPSFVGAGENMPGLYMMIPALLMGLLSIWALREAALEMRLWSAFFLILGAWVAKFLLWAVFPLAVLMVMFFRSVKPGKILFLLEVFLVSGIIVGMSSSWSAMPDAVEMDAMRDVANVTRGELIANEWNYGHYLLWWGANPEFSPLDNWDDIPNSSASWVLGNCSRWSSLELVRDYSRFCLFVR